MRLVTSIKDKLRPCREAHRGRTKGQRPMGGARGDNKVKNLKILIFSYCHVQFQVLIMTEGHLRSLCSLSLFVAAHYVTFYISY